MLPHLVEGARVGELFLAAQRDQDVGEIGDHSAAIVAAQEIAPRRPSARRRLRGFLARALGLIELDDLVARSVRMMRPPKPGPILVG